MREQNSLSDHTWGCLFRMRFGSGGNEKSIRKPGNELVSYAFWEQGKREKHTKAREKACFVCLLRTGAAEKAYESQGKGLFRMRLGDRCGGKSIRKPGKEAVSYAFGRPEPRKKQIKA